ncbi:GntR family transcriptional regulator [Streptomyces caniferus]|uniref:GntR family transcriptional regulator n=1 Tax=Streptomyces caniferus TaxID=285557 RepID=UPI00382D62D1
MKDQTPRYRQIAIAIRERIADGTYPAGSALPSESDLAEEFGVTRPTVRQGLADLRAEDAVMVISGRGMFVRDPELVALRRERNVAWNMASREAARAERAEDALRRVVSLAEELHGAGNVDLAERLRAIVLSDPGE